MKHVLIAAGLLLLASSVPASAQQSDTNFLTYLNQSNNAFRRVQSRIGGYSGANVRFRANPLGSSLAAGTVNGYYAYRLALDRRSSDIRSSMQRGRAITTSVGHLNQLPTTLPRQPQTPFQTGHPIGYGYTSRFYGYGPRN